jgi:hypothetical protein
MITFKQFLYEQLTENDFSELKKYAYDFIQKISWKPLNISDMKNNVDNFIYDDFPYGLQNISDPVTLYRILQVNSIDEINKRNLGYHFVGDKNKFSENFFESIGLEKKTPWKKFIITVRTSLDNINYKKSILTAISYPDEHEYRIKDDSILEIIDIDEFENI